MSWDVDGFQGELMMASLSLVEKGLRSFRRAAGKTVKAPVEKHLTVFGAIILCSGLLNRRLGGVFWKGKVTKKGEGCIC